MQAIYAHNVTAESRKAIYNLFAAYIHTVPLEELTESMERARRDAQLRYVVIYGAVCSYYLSRSLTGNSVVHSHVDVQYDAQHESIAKATNAESS